MILIKATLTMDFSSRAEASEISTLLSELNVANQYEITPLSYRLPVIREKRQQSLSLVSDQSMKKSNVDPVDEYVAISFQNKNDRNRFVGALGLLESDRLRIPTDDDHAATISFQQKPVAHEKKLAATMSNTKPQVLMSKSSTGQIKISEALYNQYVTRYGQNKVNDVIKLVTRISQKIPEIARDGGLVNGKWTKPDDRYRHKYDVLRGILSCVHGGNINDLSAVVDRCTQYANAFATSETDQLLKNF